MTSQTHPDIQQILIKTVGMAMHLIQNLPNRLTGPDHSQIYGLRLEEDQRLRFLRTDITQGQMPTTTKMEDSMMEPVRCLQKCPETCP